MTYYHAIRPKIIFVRASISMVSRYHGGLFHLLDLHQRQRLREVHATVFGPVLACLCYRLCVVPRRHMNLWTTCYWWTRMLCLQCPNYLFVLMRSRPRCMLFMFHLDHRDGFCDHYLVNWRV